MCSKRRHKSKAAARRFARRLLHKSPRCTPYECPECGPGVWHLTTWPRCLRFEEQRSQGG